MARQKQHTLKLTERQLRKLARLVGNYTAGSDRDLYQLYEKLCTLHERELNEKPGGYGRVDDCQGQQFPIINFDDA
ncbi:hypothetical protein [Rhizobium phage RHEph15]|uniref:Uncharacterized protein n=1 Tax=Rhizobium phage RHph_TM34 TaxID=2509556 RepID=A0A7S5QVT7_9CAUD|nr:hypothetical protein EVB35_002 [Rhizobium phage RHph_TM34]QXV74262.1 hypothetical protein [Rhizobium phage RHEph15]QXV74957.1 hypothetical protein [Rhizobium phage RHEph27]